MMTQRLRHTVLSTLAALGLVACGTTAANGPDEPKPTPEEVSSFLGEFEKDYRDQIVGAETAAWNRTTNITEETEAAEAKASEALMGYVGSAVKRASTFSGVDVDPGSARKLELIRRGTSLSAPSEPKTRTELASTASRMGSIYDKGEHCTGDTCRDLVQLSVLMAQSRDPKALLDAWQGWRTASVPLRPMYARFVELANQGAREIGYADMGAQWRGGYDMTAEELEKEVDRLWSQVKPLYEQLHCHVRARLNEKYGADVAPSEGPIPAHLLGNMWSQSWENVYDLVAPYPEAPGVDVGPNIVKKNLSPEQMVRIGEGFFTSIGLDALPDSFWKRSMLSQPKDRDVGCHASAWDVKYADDLRISMCIQQTTEDLITIHHELGHIYYFHAYYMLPIIYQNGANDGFHEGIGDAVALSVTPSYLAGQGLLEGAPDTREAMLNRQMSDGLAKVAFLPFARVVDQWRWDVFAGKTPTERFNADWWTLRTRLQGIVPPVERTEEHFDPGAKYHVAHNVPYLRYFLAHILQFQFHRAMCRAAGHEGPLHECSVFGSKEAGAKLQAMLELGASKPWPDALEVMTGEREMDGEALLQYFAPLSAWLAEQNEGRTCGW